MIAALDSIGCGPLCRWVISANAVLITLFMMGAVATWWGRK